MQVGDLVRYDNDGDGACSIGIILSINEDGYYKVLWSDGNCDEDLVYSELEVIKCK
tara:strand:+ start:2631 stop:2798 length:168 start_codon:yes stop_codon:yes gene_type:complete